MSLLEVSGKGQNPHLTSAEPFSDTFGPKAQRKKPRIDVGSFEEMLAGPSTEKGKEKAIIEEGMEGAPVV